MLNQDVIYSCEYFIYNCSFIHEKKNRFTNQTIFIQNYLLKYHISRLGVALTNCCLSFLHQLKEISNEFRYLFPWLEQCRWSENKLLQGQLLSGDCFQYFLLCL